MTVNLYGMTDLWNDAGTVWKSISLDVTASAYATQSSLLDLKMGGVSVIKHTIDTSGNFHNFQFSPTGFILTGGLGGSSQALLTIGSSSFGNAYFQFDVNQGFLTGTIGFPSGGIGFFNTTCDVFLQRQAAGLVALLNGTTNSTGFHAYNTKTDASNYERGVFDWTTTSNTLTIGTQAAGTGTNRGLALKTSGAIISIDNGTMGWLFNNNQISATSGVFFIDGSVGSVNPLALIFSNPISRTISSGSIVGNASVLIVDTEAGAASDDLDTITNTTTGTVMVVRAANSARTVVAKDGTGNLKLAGDFSLDNAEDTLTLIYDGTNCLEISRSDNGA